MSEGHDISHHSVQMPRIVTRCLEPTEKQPSPLASSDMTRVPFEQHIETKMSPSPFKQCRRKKSALDIGDYFAGPRDIARHSKWPTFMRMHGSIMPKMIVPLVFVALWSTAITCLYKLADINLNVSSLLLTVIGFVVALSLSFRSSTAYERYAEGRKFWTNLMYSCNNLGRVIWINTRANENNASEFLLGKLTALNLLIAFAVALKHKLRWEPYTDYEDLAALVDHLDTFARAATRDDTSHVQLMKTNFFKATAQYLGIPFATPNPRKALKRATRPLGNLPLEILNYLAVYVDELCLGGLLPIPMTQTLAYNNIAALNDILTACDRIATTPLPIAYQIVFSQITWAYVLSLPFQLLQQLGWVTIPAAIVASYIILAILLIGNEIEDPFGQDVNDLPLDVYCAQIAHELDILTSRPVVSSSEWICSSKNKPLHPAEESGYNVLIQRGEADIYRTLRQKVERQVPHYEQVDSRSVTQHEVATDMSV